MQFRRLRSATGSLELSLIVVRTTKCVDNYDRVGRLKSVCTS